MAEGKTLDDAEMEYVKIFANLKDFEKAQQKAELKHDFSEDFVKDLESKGISRDELEGMQIKIESIVCSASFPVIGSYAGMSDICNISENVNTIDNARLIRKTSQKSTRQQPDKDCKRRQPQSGRGLS